MSKLVIEGDGVKVTRPVHLNLTLIRFPITAVASILHRITGVILFIFIPILLLELQNSLQSAESFEHLKEGFDTIGGQLLGFIIIGSFIYHFLAGIRHLLMDFGYGESHSIGRWTAKMVIIVSPLLALVLIYGVGR